jgi:large subunit ribosomal protein L15
MTKRRSKKNKSGSHGHGSSKKNRGAGSRGGRGNAGSGKKGQSQRMTEEGVQEMGETGFNSRQTSQEGINLRDIDQRIQEFVEQGSAEEKDGKYVFHASEAGYDKVLGQGQLRKQIEIHAEKFSDSAENKIEESEGEAIKEE